MTRSAIISNCGIYRYVLTRQWATGVDRTLLACFIGLNPSTADAEKDDHTIRKLVGFCKRWGLDGFKIVNLYALRSRDPNALIGHPDPVGPENEGRIIQAATEAELVVACWGNHRTAKNRGPELLGKLRAIGIVPRCFGKTADGQPKHPLTLPYRTELVSV